MTTTLKLYDSANYLRSENDIAGYLSTIAEDGDPALMAHALGVVARARNVSALARDIGMTRVGLTKALSSKGNPSFATITKVAKALGMKLTFVPDHSVPNDKPIT